MCGAVNVCSLAYIMIDHMDFILAPEGVGIRIMVVIQVRRGLYTDVTEHRTPRSASYYGGPGYEHCPDWLIFCGFL
jgi:hypothetical protein